MYSSSIVGMFLGVDSGCIYGIVGDCYNYIICDINCYWVYLFSIWKFKIIVILYIILNFQLYVEEVWL